MRQRGGNYEHNPKEREGPGREILCCSRLTLQPNLY